MSPARFRKLDWWRIGWLGLTLLPPALILVWLLSWSVNTVWQDEWNFIPMLIQARSDHFDWMVLWESHNVHRMVVPRLLTLSLAQFGGWDARREELASWVVACVILVLFALLLNKTQISRRQRMIWLFVGSALIFSTSQSENWVWSFQLAWYLCVMFAIAGLLSLLWRKGSWFSLGVAAVCCTLSSICMATGLMAWPALALGLGFDQRPRRAARLAVWTGLAVVCFLVYFYGMIPEEKPASHIPIWQLPLQLVVYFLIYLGAPLVKWAGLWASGGVGGLLLLLVGAAAVRLWLARRSQPTLWETSLPWLQLILFASLNGLSTAVGRVSFGVEQALAIRYFTVSNLVWLGGGLIIYQALRLPRTDRRLRWVAWVGSGVAVLAFLVISLSGYTQFRSSYNLQAAAVPIIYNCATAPNALLVGMYPEAAYIHQMCPQLSKANLSLLKQPFDQYAQQAVANWQAETNKRSRTVYKFDSIQALNLINPIRHTTPDQIDFDSSASDPTSLKLPNTASIVHRGNYMEIKSRQAHYINLLWTPPNGLTQTLPLYGYSDGAGWYHFWVIGPVDAVTLQLDLYYQTASSQPDSIQVAVYN